MKKWTILLLALLLLVLWIKKTRNTGPRYISEGEIVQPGEISPIPPGVVIPVVKEINERNWQIQSVIFREIKLRFKEGVFSIGLHGDMFYEKSRNFQAELRSVFGKELELGSNDTYFWFWSRRMEPPAIFYCRHDEMHKSRLRTPFNPVWIIESLGLGEISTQDAQVEMMGKYCKIVQMRRSTLGKMVKKTTLIDCQKKAIIGHYIHDNNQLIVSSEVEEFSHLDGFMIPKKVCVIWHEEKVVLHWDFLEPAYIKTGSPRLNIDWKMPRGKLMIDMATY